MINPKLKSFKNFLYLCFKTLGIGEPTDAQYEIATVLQKGPKRVIISAFRGIGKSWITAIYVLYRLYHDRSLNILVVSASKQRSDDFSTFCFKIMREVPELNDLLPDEKVDRFSKVAFDVAGAPASQSTSVRSMGIFSQLTGARADIIIADDVETPGTSETQGMREKLAERVKEFEAILKPVDDTRIIFLGTPQTEDSVYNDLVKRNYTRILWPARYPSVKWMTQNGHELSESLRIRMEADSSLLTGYGADGSQGAATDPKRFNETELVDRELSYGRSGFALQFMVDTTLSDQDRYPLKLRDLIVMEFGDMAPDHPVWGPGKPVEDLRNVGFRGDHFYAPAAINGTWRPFEGSIMAIDPAGRGADELAYVVIKQLNGFLYVAECHGFQSGYEERNLEALARIAKKHNCSKIVVESNFGDGLFAKVLMPVLRAIYPCTIEEIRSNKQKEKRICDTLEPVLNAHKLVMSKAVITQDATITESNQLNRQLLFQLTRITRDKGALLCDDRIDVLAIGVGFLKDAMAKDTEREIAEHKMRELDKVLSDFWEPKQRNKKREAPNWVSSLIRRR
jgi:hypothetical protein